MTTYTAILDTQIDPDAPITSVLGYQFRDNPIAIAEGAADAPRIAIKSFIGDGSPVDIVSIGDFTGVELNIFANNSDAAIKTLDIALSDNGGTSFYASSTIYTINTGNSIHSVGFVDFTSGSSKFIIKPPSGAGSSISFTLAGASSNVDAFRVSLSGLGNISLYGTLNGGSTTV